MLYRKIPGRVLTPLTLNKHFIVATNNVPKRAKFMLHRVSTKSEKHFDKLQFCLSRNTQNMKKMTTLLLN